MKWLLTFFVFAFLNISFSQSKREQIELLNFRLDSLNQILKAERNTHQEKVTAYNSTISNLQSQLSSLNLKMEETSKELTGSKTKLNSQNDQIKELKTVINDLKKLVDIKKDSISLLLKNINSEKHIPIKLPFKYGKKRKVEEEYLATFFYSEENRFYVITDSVDTELNQGQHKIRMYFVTPIVEELGLNCPHEFGIIVINSQNKIIYQNIRNSSASAYYNFFLSYNKLLVLNKERPLLCLGSSACGSGASLMYYNLHIINGIFELEEAFPAEYNGFGFTKIYPDKNLYVEFERINPEAHYVGNTRYKMKFYNLTTNNTISVKESKYIYEHFIETGEDELIEKIREKEPNLLSF